MANWDEDSITMSVEAARDCLAGRDRSAIGQLILASTTHPYDDRQNAGIAANALNLASSLAVLDVTGSQRAGTSALATALAAASGNEILVTAGEHRRTKAASPQEMHYGDGAAAILVGKGKPIARLLAAHSETVDFVDHFRGADAEHDYAWEERWIRDEGYMKIVPRALEAVLKAAGAKPESVTHFCMPCTLSRVGPAVAKRAVDSLDVPVDGAGAAELEHHRLGEHVGGDVVLVGVLGERRDRLEVVGNQASGVRSQGIGGRRLRRPSDLVLPFGRHILSTTQGGAMAKQAVARTVVDCDSFRFEKVQATDDPMMLPGAVKYGGLSALGALSAPGELLVHRAEGAGVQRWLSIALGVGLLIGLFASRRLALWRPITSVVDRVKAGMSFLLRRRAPDGLLVLGLLNGLLPCGLVYVAGAGATATGDLIQGALYMFAFGLGTVPMMLAISLSGKLVPFSIRLKLLKAVPAAVVILATLLILRGMELGIPYVSPLLSSNDVSCCH